MSRRITMARASAASTSSQAARSSPRPWAHRAVTRLVAVPTETAWIGIEGGLGSACCGRALLIGFPLALLGRAWGAV
jgi:hypothetical protein